MFKKEQWKKNFMKEREMGSVKYTRMYELISQQWLTTPDIQELCECGQHKAREIRKEIEMILTNKGKKLPVTSLKSVPTKLFLEYMEIDSDYVFKMAKQESALKGEEV